MAVVQVFITLMIIKIINSLSLVNKSLEIGDTWEEYDDPLLGVPLKFNNLVTNISSEDETEDYNPIVGAPINKTWSDLYLLTQDENLDESFFLNWDVEETIRDAAYYIRDHKFNDFDRRYYRNMSDYEKTSSSRLYQEFAKPRLNSLHWQVLKYCNGGFFQCLKYVDSMIKKTSPKRLDDILYVIIKNNWSRKTHNQQINVLDNQCKSSRDNYSPFQGPLERFQWRTSVSYYLCWYTILNRPEMKHFNESCDNFANCLDDKYFTNNKDPRADDKIPFACAFYSFCPDPCCPLKHVSSILDCSKSLLNPCLINSKKEYNNCYFPFENNYNFNSLISNKLNLTCDCDEPGYEWSSKFGLCIDIDECSTNLHDCWPESHTVCVNLPGSFDCVCELGYEYDNGTEKCKNNYAVQNVLRQSLSIVSSTPQSFFK
ncbi:uncharacterized protein LOC123268077 [Cotesia glomerata]|uniref:uncharacterized protein LOC123268077 n=1 Tax=Cotesia glomerata TaxID=32391 RepID=UPI001D00B7F7|nr:uncharacterized protein LOC123268077 [Cotesia glomerata]